MINEVIKCKLSQKPHYDYYSYRIETPLKIVTVDCICEITPRTKCGVNACMEVSGQMSEIW